MDRSINRVELRGHVGQEPRINETSSSKVIKFTIATNERYKDRSGQLKEETTWHNIVAWMGKGMPDFSEIKKGSLVSVNGRVRNTKFTTPDGVDKIYSEVVASRLKVEDIDNLDN